MDRRRIGGMEEMKRIVFRERAEYHAQGACSRIGILLLMRRPEGRRHHTPFLD